MQIRISGWDETRDILSDRELIATRRIILRKLSARMKNGGFDAEQTSAAPVSTGESGGETIPATSTRRGRAATHNQADLCQQH